MRHLVWLLAALFILLLAVRPLPAQQATPYPDSSTDKEDLNKPKRILTPEEKREKAERRACKIEICTIFSLRETDGRDIDCPVTKTWREEDIEDMLSGGQFRWPWGKARCSTQLKLSRAALATAAGEGKVDIVMEPHTITCSLDLKSGGETYDVKVNIAPEVKFQDGKAVKAKMNWGNVDAPMLAYSVIWPAASLDNSLNVLGGQIVKMTNEFMGKKCDQVKDEIPKRAAFRPAPR